MIIPPEIIPYFLKGHSDMSRCNLAKISIENSTIPLKNISKTPLGFHSAIFKGIPLALFSWKCLRPFYGNSLVNSTGISSVSFSEIYLEFFLCLFLYCFEKWFDNFILIFLRLFFWKSQFLGYIFQHAQFRIYEFPKVLKYPKILPELWNEFLK